MDCEAIQTAGTWVSEPRYEPGPGRLFQYCKFFQPEFILMQCVDDPKWSLFLQKIYFHK